MCTLRSNQGRWAEAARHCETALEIDPDFCDVHSNLATIAIAHDDLGMAVHRLNLSLPCVFTNVKAYKTLLALYDIYLRRDPQVRPPSPSLPPLSHFHPLPHPMPRRPVATRRDPSLVQLLSCSAQLLRCLRASGRR